MKLNNKIVISLFLVISTILMPNTVYSAKLPSNYVSFGTADNYENGITSKNTYKEWFDDGEDKNFNISHYFHLQFKVNGTLYPCRALLFPSRGQSGNSNVIGGSDCEWVLLFVTSDYNMNGETSTWDLNVAYKLSDKEALDIMQSKKLENFRLADAGGSKNTSVLENCSIEYEQLKNIGDLNACNYNMTPEFWDIIGYALGNNLYVTEDNDGVSVLRRDDVINGNTDTKEPLQYRKSGFKYKEYVQESDGWSYLSEDKGILLVFNSYEDDILKIKVKIKYKDESGIDSELDVTENVSINPDDLFVNRYNSGDDTSVSNSIYSQIRRLLSQKAYNEYKSAGGNSESSQQRISNNDLEQAKFADGNTTSVNEWFFKINYFFSTGVDATDTVENGGLNASGAKISDYGRVWIKPSEYSGITDINADIGEDYYSANTNGVFISDGNQEEKGVTLEEDLRIRTYFNILAQYMYFSSEKYNKTYSLNGETYESFVEYVRQLANLNYGIRNTITVGGSGISDNEYELMNPDVIDIGNTGNSNTNMSREKANAAAESKFRKVSDKPSYYSTAVNFDSIVDYYGYGIVSDEKYTDGNGNTGDIKYNEAIENCVPKFLVAMDSQLSSGDTNINKEALSFNGIGLPRLDVFGRINRSIHSFKFYGEINTALMFIRQYAEIPKTLGKLEEGSGGEQTNNIEEQTIDNTKWYYNTGTKGTYATSAMLEFKSDNSSDREITKVESLGKDELKSKIVSSTLETFINENVNNSGSSPNNMTDEVAKLIAAYIHIHNGLSRLFGDESSILENKWLSPELKRIYLYYDEIKKWENEPSVETATNVIEPDEREAFRMFFQFDDISVPMFTDAYVTGVALSATYIPLITNLYDPEVLSIIDNNQEWVDNFHYKYGFNRKALFIDSDEDAAIKSYVTGEKGSLRVATLKDMLQPEKDIVLYVDTNMYNIDKVAEMQQLAYSRIQNSEEAGVDSSGIFQSLGDGLANFMEIGAENIYKSGAVKLYSNKYASSVSPYGTDVGKEKEGKWFDSIWSPDNFILSTSKIEEYTYADEYQPMQSAAFTCGVYRDKNIFNICQNQSANPQPVFISSPSLAGIKDQNAYQYSSIFNYLMLKNISNNRQVDIDMDIDEDTPLFIDIYGNISTQSGLVVIPAACNSTLYTPDNYNIATAGFISMYNKFDSKKLEQNYNNSDKYMSHYGFIEENNSNNSKYWGLDDISINGYTIYTKGLGMSSNKIKKLLYKIGKETFAQNQLSSNKLFNQRVNMIIEVMRGAPLEFISFDKEGLAKTRNIDKTALYVTYRVEQLTDLLTSGSNGNNLIQLPNLAYMTNVEYIVVFLFKALFAVGIFILMMNIYIDGISGVLGWKTILRFILSITSVIFGIIFVPAMLNVSYYQTNKYLLQDEVVYINMINTEKKALGKETGIVEIKKPESNSELFLKLDQVKIPWYVVASEFGTNQFRRMKEVYNEAFQSSIYMSFDGVKQKGSGLYISIGDILDSSIIVFKNYENDSNNTKGYIFQVITNGQELSYVFPYYYILDQLLYEVGVYNEAREGSSFVTKFKSNGNIMTYGLIEPYLLSDGFLGGSENLLGLYEIYDIEPSSNRHISVLDALPDNTDETKEEIMDKMKRTLWYQANKFSKVEIEEKLKKLDYEARKFVVDNRLLLNKVSDETFIKCMALDLAIKYNDIFRVPAARAYDVMDIDTRDIMRMSLAPKNQVMKHASKSFANFVLSYGGFFSVCAVVLLVVIYWILSLIKPLLIILLLLLLVISYIYKKLIRRENNKSFEGYIVSITLIMIVNILYALSLKVSIWIPSLNINAFVAIFFQVIIQLLYLIILSAIGYIVIKNSIDMGYYTYKTMYDSYISNSIQAVSIKVDKLVSKLTGTTSESARRRLYNYNRNIKTELTGNEILEHMKERDEEIYGKK